MRGRVPAIKRLGRPQSSPTLEFLLLRPPHWFSAFVLINLEGEKAFSPTLLEPNFSNLISVAGTLMGFFGMVTSCDIILREGSTLSFSNRHEGDILKLGFCLRGRSS